MIHDIYNESIHIVFIWATRNTNSHKWVLIWPLVYIEDLIEHFFTIWLIAFDEIANINMNSSVLSGYQVTAKHAVTSP